jgi:sigma-B regulation protein RsbU (phosphoserine phosphatase)
MYPGDLIVLYTDGVTEAENGKDEMFGVLRLKEVVLASHRIPSSDIIQAILGSVKDFTGDEPQSDDITLMVIRRQ